MKRETLNPPTDVARTAQSDISREGDVIEALKACEYALGAAIRTDKIGWLQEEAHKDACEALAKCRSGSTNAAGGSSHAASVSQPESGRASSAPSITADAGKKQILDYLEQLIIHCPHAVIRHNDDPDVEDELGAVPVGFSIRVDGCRGLVTSVGATLREAVINDAAQAGFALTAAKPSAAPTAEALEEVARKCAASAWEDLRLSVKLLGPWPLYEEFDNGQSLIAEHILVALKQVAHPAGKEKMREALEQLRDELTAEISANVEDPRYPRTNATMRVIVAMLERWRYLIDAALSSETSQREMLREECERCGGQGWYPHGCPDKPQQEQCEACYGTGLAETPQRDEQKDSGRETDSASPETRTPQIADGRTSQSDASELLHVVQAAYLKHHVGKDDVGWEKLSEMMQNALCNAMGDDAFCEWLDANREEEA